MLILVPCKYLISFVPRCCRIKWCIILFPGWQFPVFNFQSVVSDSLWPHGLQHARRPCPSTTLGVYSNSCLLSRWCHPTTSSSVVPFSCLQSLPASGSFQMSQFSHQVAKVLEFQLQHQSFQWIFRTDFFRIDWFDVFAVQGTLKTLSNTTVQKLQFFGPQLSL